MKKVILLSILIFTQFQIFSQEEKMEVEGAIQISGSEDPTPDAGTIRWTGSDFEGFNGVIWVSLTGNISVGSVTDLDGNVYKTITIGGNEWMTENLRVTQYNDGVAIPEVQASANWITLSTGAWCNYNNDPTMDIPYGKYYNWYAVDTGILCPTGWHVPTDSEYSDLIDFLDPDPIDPNMIGVQSNVAGGKLKEAGLAHWETPNGGATNETGFTFLPTGFRDWNNGSFSSLGFYGYLWTSTSHFNTVNAYTRDAFYLMPTADRYYRDKKHGFAVRCVKN